MNKMTFLERRYRRSHLDCVRHTTLDPRGPGVVRLHMIPPGTEDPNDPFLLLINGAKLVPLNLSWAVLLANFMDQLEPYAGREIGPEDWDAMAREDGILVRNLTGQEGLADCLRITVGTQEENEAMLESLARNVMRGYADA